MLHFTNIGPADCGLVLASFNYAQELSGTPLNFGAPALSCHGLGQWGACQFLASPEGNWQ
ncbi:MAG TPA: hypothetical protein VKA38_03190 [Draconibacterium sp.]|nr:hypothetical protein [Draconibacterium sp.]